MYIYTYIKSYTFAENKENDKNMTSIENIK